MKGNTGSTYWLVQVTRGSLRKRLTAEAPHLVEALHLPAASQKHPANITCIPRLRTHSPGENQSRSFRKLPDFFYVLLLEKKLKMNQSDLKSVLSSAEFDFERRFDERWALSWMQENWWVQGGQLQLGEQSVLLISSPTLVFTPYVTRSCL